MKRNSFVTCWQESTSSDMIIDLTHPLKNGIAVYPGTPQPSFAPCNSIERDGFAEKIITMSSHTGTHIDAPCHILPEGRTLDSFPMEKFVGPGIVIDCYHANSISLDILRPYEKEIAKRDFLLFYTGWQEKWGSNDYFHKFPVLTEAATRWLLGFDFKAVGFDAISVDSVDDHLLPNHHLFLEREILIIENLNWLDRIVGKRFDLYCIPLKIAEADGAPVRVFAMMGE